jgi:RNA polymerase sigma-70 factor (family 1)
VSDSGGGLLDTVDDVGPRGRLAAHRPMPAMEVTPHAMRHRSLTTSGPTGSVPAPHPPTNARPGNAPSPSPHSTSAPSNTQTTSTRPNEDFASDTPGRPATPQADATDRVSGFRGTIQRSDREDDIAPDDVMLLRRIRADDATAFTVLFRRYHSRLCRVAAHRIGSYAIGEELVQDVFLALWERRHSLSIHTAAATYLHVAVRNAATSYVRREQLLERYSTDIVAALQGNDLEIDAAIVQRELISAARAAIARLPERCRLVLTYHRLCQMTYKETAETLGISPKTVDAHMVRAVKLLRAQLCELDGQRCARVPPRHGSAAVRWDVDVPPAARRHPAAPVRKPVRSTA